MRKFLSTGEAAAILGVTSEAVRLRAASGRIPAVRTSAGWMVDGAAVAREEAVGHGGRIGSEGVRAIRAALQRRAFSNDRAGYWAGRIQAAASPQGARGVIALIDQIAGRDGTTAASAGSPWPSTGYGELDGLMDDEFSGFGALWGPQPGGEVEWEAARAQADREAASLSAAREAEADEFDGLFPPGDCQSAMADIFGEGPPLPPMPAEFHRLWPPGEFAAAPGKPGHVQNDVPRVTYTAPDEKGRNRKKKKVKPKPPPGPYKTTRSKPGSDQIDRSGGTQQGK
jgi:hypothetical protein